MPTYIYWCGACDAEWTKFNFIADRYESGPCPECHSEGGKIKIGLPSNHTFRKRWFEGIDSQPVFIESAKQLKSIEEKNKCYVVSDDRKKQKAYYERRGMVEEGKRVCERGR